MKTFIQIAISGIFSFILILISVPILKVISSKINLTDKPNARKIHQTPIPLVGGIAIAISVAIVGIITYYSFGIFKEQLIIFVVSAILLFVGVLDDMFDINAKYKLIIQFFCAFAVSAVGIRITSLYGIFGIHEIPVFLQYILTIIIICGVVNAFNLMDGIDGLSGELAIIGFFFLSIFSFLIGDYAFTIIFASFIGATIGFLKFNFKVEKIFLGDAGSLFIGSILVNSSIYLLTQHMSYISSKPLVLYTIIGFLALPVLDSLRVYLGRIKKGSSPLKADKTHLHHLMLLMTPSHRRASLIISIIAICLLLFTTFIQYYLSITFSLILVVIIFSALSLFLNLNKKVMEWRDKIKELEK